jgi:hypothetical protein
MIVLALFAAPFIPAGCFNTETNDFHVLRYKGDFSPFREVNIVFSLPLNNACTFGNMPERSI